MSQAIMTKYLGPTLRRPSRIVAQADAGRVVVSCRFDLSNEDNHKAAARTLMFKLGWNGKFITGGIGNNYVHVFLPAAPAKSKPHTS